MENYLIVNEKFAFSNKKLNKSMDAILDEYKRAQKGSENVAKALTAIKDGELWRDDFDSFETCISTFGIGKAQAYRVISSYKLKYNEECDGRLENFTLTQVAEIARLEISLFCDLIDNGEITPEMSCAKIRSVVNNYKNEEEPDDTDGEEPTDDGEELDTTYKVVISGADFIIEDVKVQKAITKVLEKYGIISYAED